MRICFGLMLLAIMSAVVLTACGGDSSGPTEETLEARAEALGTAIVDGDYSELYEFGLPNSNPYAPRRIFWPRHTPN